MFYQLAAWREAPQKIAMRFCFKAYDIASRAAIWLSIKSFLSIFIQDHIVESPASWLQYVLQRHLLGKTLGACEKLVSLGRVPTHRLILF